LSIFALIGCLAAPVMADEGSSGLRLDISNSALPAFVPPSGRGNFTTALNDNSASAIASRHAAEALSAKFSDMTTNSIAKEDQEASTVAPVAAPDPPHIVTTPAARSIVLASSHDDEKENAKRPMLTRHRSGAHDQGHRIPRRAFRKAPSTSPRDRQHELPGEESSGSLAAIGKKVSILDLLTNPALWY
jgi:hypothetical protein